MDDLISPLRAVSVLDEAIDHEATPVRVYAESRADVLVSMLPGSAPRWATMRPLSAGDFLACDSMPTPPVKLRQAFALSCAEIENFDGAGLSLKPEKPHRLPDGRERLVWSDAGIQRVADRLGFRFIYEMGGIAYERAEQGNALSGGVLFTLPPSSESALSRIERQRAERLAASSGIRSSEKSARS